MLRQYILNEAGEPVLVPFLKFVEWLQQGGDTAVASTRVRGVRVSTIFLGTDHNFFGKGPPILWETMVFGGKLDLEGGRCAGTREQAEAMHEVWCKKVQASQQRAVKRVYGRHN